MVFLEPKIDFLQVIRQHFLLTCFGSMDVICCGMASDIDKVAILKNIQGDVTIEKYFLNIYLGYIFSWIYI